MKNWLLLVSIYSISLSCMSQNNFENTLKYSEEAGSPYAELADIAWIAGHWKGKAMGGEIEELWTSPLGGSMMGSFKLVVDGKVIFYELETISAVDSTLIMRIKHFNEDLTGWEEKNETEDFKLVKITHDAVYFDQLTFKKYSDDEIGIYVVIDNDNGPREVLFSYRRVD